MKIKLLSLIFIIISCKAVSYKTMKEKSPLFNGKNLNGWTVYGTEMWYVENGLLVCENGSEENFGYLGTNKKYQNFELNLEFKQETNGNGGVFVNSIIDGTTIDGWQVEIGPPGHNTGGIHVYDRGWLVKPDLIKDKVLKMGEWNHLKIILENDKMIVWLNNIEMVSLLDSKIKTRKGLIALQIHKGNVTKLQWKNIEITEL